MARESGRVRGMMDFVLEAWVSANIERAKASWILGNGHRWQPGQKLKLHAKANRQQHYTSRRSCALIPLATARGSVSTRLSFMRLPGYEFHSTR